MHGVVMKVSVQRAKFVNISTFTEGGGMRFLVFLLAVAPWAWIGIPIGSRKS